MNKTLEDMEVKEDLVIDKLLCMACLCIGRTLYEISDERMQHYYLRTLNNIPLCNIPQVCPSICWECKALLRKAVLFMEQVKDSYRILQTYTSENLHEYLLTDITRSPRFKEHHIDPISIPPSSESQCFIEVEVKPDDKLDVPLVCVKEESQDWSGDLDDILTNNDRSPTCLENENISDSEKDLNNIISKKEKRKRNKSPLNNEQNSTELKRDTNSINAKKEKRKRNKSPLLYADDNDEIEDVNISPKKEKRRSKKRKEDKIKKGKNLVKRIKTANKNLHECLLTDITRSPRFKEHHIDPISIPPSSESQCFIEVEVKPDDKLDVPLVCVKEESQDWSGDLDDILTNNAGSPSCLENISDSEKDLNNIISKKEKRKRNKSPLNNEQNSTELKRDTNSINAKKEKRKRNKSPLLYADDNDEIEDVNISPKKEKRISKKRKEDKIKKGKNLVKRIKTANKLIKNTRKDEEGRKILTIELSYEEMLLERERDSLKESYVKSEYKCETCLIGFNYAKSYESHVKTKHSPNLGNYSCPICKTIIASVESFTSHYKRHMRRYECSICQKRTMDVKVMQQHYYSTHEIQLGEYECKLCGKISNSIDTHRYHKDTHKARIQCKECDKTFSHRAGLLNHRLAVHELHNDFPCSVCGKTFRWKSSLKRHLEKHDSKDAEGGPAACCSPCGISFSSVSSYQRHLRNSLKHVSHNQLRFICDHCNRRFADKTKLRDHIEEKHLHKTYTCHICSKPSKNRVGLDQHIRNVHKGRPNNKVCHYCGKAFPTKPQLESHIRTHTGEKPFICEICPTTFSQQSNLYKHNRQVHLNIKSKRYPVVKKISDVLMPPEEPQYNNTRPMLYFSPNRGFI